MTGVGRPRGTAWTGDDRLARAAWSRLAEPGDPVAGAALAALGAGEALTYVLRGTPLPGHVGELLGEQGTRRRLQDALEGWRVRLTHLAPERDLATLERFGGRLVTPADPGWPAGVDDLGLGAPVALWVLGEPDLADAVRRAVSVVGSRASSGYGELVAGEIAAGVADRGIAVVSGGAFGIDARAHRAALGVGGVTVAVLACGVDRYYPKAHEPLLRQIAQDGLVLSELPPGTMPMRGRFLQRNRLIAALTPATVVVEAAWRSGALATASHAAGLGRALGAVPGPVTSPTSAGCHRMLRDFGATCVTDAAEVAELIGAVGEVIPPEPTAAAAGHDGLSGPDLQVFDALPIRRGVSLDRLVSVAGLAERTVAASLGRLHLGGLAEVTRVDGEPMWRRARRAPTRTLQATPPRRPAPLGEAPRAPGA